MFRHKIIEELRYYVKGRANAEALEQWLLAHYQLILDSGERDAINLCNEINALFIELGEDVISREELDLTIRMILLREELTISITVGHMLVETLGQPTVNNSFKIAGQVTTEHRKLQVA